MAETSAFMATIVAAIINYSTIVYHGVARGRSEPPLHCYSVLLTTLILVSNFSFFFPFTNSLKYSTALLDFHFPGCCCIKYQSTLYLICAIKITENGELLTSAQMQEVIGAI